MFTRAVDQNALWRETFSKRGAQLGCRLAALITQVDVVSLPVVAEDAGVLHGQM